MESAAKAEVAVTHLNAQEANHAQEEMGHPQPATRIRTDDATAKGFVNNTVKIKRSETFDKQIMVAQG